MTRPWQCMAPETASTARRHGLLPPPAARLPRPMTDPSFSINSQTDLVERVILNYFRGS